MKREKKWDRAQKLRALVVELSVAAEDMVEYNNYSHTTQQTKEEQKNDD